jgi:hypothetical protein
LVTGANTLAPEGEIVELSEFTFEVVGDSSHAPTANEIEITAAYDEEEHEVELFFNVFGNRQIVAGGNRYEISLGFRITTSEPRLAVKQLVLDLAGSAIGTSGDGRVTINQAIRTQGSDLAASGEVVFGDIASSVSIARSLLTPASPRLALLVGVVADGGGAGDSAAVLTDWTLRLALAEVPEPGGGVILGHACLACAAARSGRRRGQPWGFVGHCFLGRAFA